MNENDLNNFESENKSAQSFTIEPEKNTSMKKTWWIRQLGRTNSIKSTQRPKGSRKTW